MKKYRCPWCLSTGNHNILYFVDILGTCSLNTAICLWKASKALLGAGLRGVFCPKTGADPKATDGQARFPSHRLSVAHAWTRHKAQKWCNWPAELCELWTIRTGVGLLSTAVLFYESWRNGLVSGLGFSQATNRPLIS